MWDVDTISSIDDVVLYYCNGVDVIHHVDNTVVSSDVILLFEELLYKITFCDNCGEHGYRFYKDKYWCTECYYDEVVSDDIQEMALY